jgi:hypothetical protein
MKSTKSIVFLSAAIFTITSTVKAQNVEASLSPAYTKATAVAETPVTPAAPSAIVGKEVVINLKNSAEKPVVIFAGPKENIREPKINTYGGLSLNKLYLHENEVVCLMTNDLKPKACAMIKPGVSTVEIDISANTLSGR